MSLSCSSMALRVLGSGPGFRCRCFGFPGSGEFFHSPAVLAFDFARPDAAVEQPTEKAVEGLSVPQVGQIAVNDWRQYVRAVAINEKFVQYLLVVDAPQAAGYIPFGRYDECLVAAFAVGAMPGLRACGRSRRCRRASATCRAVRPKARAGAGFREYRPA